MIPRRSFLLGLGSLIAAPAIVRASSLMPVRGIIMDVPAWTPQLMFFSGRYWWVENGIEIHYSAKVDRFVTETIQA